jgi:hypothetical protein
MLRNYMLERDVRISGKCWSICNFNKKNMMLVLFLGKKTLWYLLVDSLACFYEKIRFYSCQLEGIDDIEKQSILFSSHSITSIQASLSILHIIEWSCKFFVAVWLFLCFFLCQKCSFLLYLVFPWYRAANRRFLSPSQRFFTRVGTQNSELGTRNSELGTASKCQNIAI